MPITNKTSAQTFLALYSEVDTYMRKYLRHHDLVPHHSLIDEMASRERRFDTYRFDLHTFARLRNAIVHNPYAGAAEPIAEPHEAAVAQYESIVKLLTNPPRAIDHATKAAHFFTTTLNDNALGVMRVMKDKRFKYVPVIHKNHVIGVFSENVVFSYLAEQGGVLDDKSTIDVFRPFLGFDAHSSEYFEFISQDTPLDTIEQLFAKTFKDTKRLAVVYLTKKGSYKEPLLGMMTAWDVLGHSH